MGQVETTCNENPDEGLGFRGVGPHAQNLLILRSRSGKTERD